MKIVILGGGSIGGSVANELSTEENDVIVIDNNQENLDSLSSKEGILTINGNASSPSTLKKANLDDDTLLLCLTDSEEVNLLASIVAKSKFNVGKVVCRLIGSDYEKISQDIASGVDYFINPENLITEEIKELLHHPGSLEILDFVDNRLKLVSVYAKESGLLVGKQIRELRDHLPDYETRIPAIYRDEELIIPNGETIIQKDDEVYFVADEKHIEQVTRELQKLVSKVSYIILNMVDIIFVTTDNCELCSKALNKIKKIRLLINLKFVNVENDYQEFLLRVPVVLYKGEILDEGQISLMKILKKLIFKI